MRLRLLALLPTVALLAMLLPAAASSAHAPVPHTVVDEVTGLPPAAGTRADGAGAARGGARTTAELRTPIAFSLLAFTAPPGTEISFRTSRDGVTWTSWTAAEEPEGVGPDQGSTEALHAAPDHRRSGEPMWVGEATWLQARVAGAPLRDVDVDLVDSLGLSRSLWQRTGDALRAAWHGAGPAAAQAADGRPAIVTRARWGADETLRKGAPAAAERARYGVLHHTVGSNSYSAAEAPAVVRGIYAYHTRSRGWSDIGYNFLVDRFGTIYEGRHGGIDRAVIGAHALGFNTGGIGVAMLGSFDATAVPRATRDAVADLFAWKFSVHGINARGSVSVTSTCSGASCKHARGTVVKLPTLFGHRDVGYTACPGARGYATLPGLRKAVAARQADVLTNHSVAPRTVALGSGGLERSLTFTAGVVPAAAWDFVVKYDDGTVVHRASGEGDTARVRWSGAPGMRRGTYWYKFTSGSRAPAVGAFTVTRPAFVGPFSDDDASVHVEGITDLYNRGITKGCTATTFCPGKEVSRGQMASFVTRTMDHLDVSYRQGTRDWFSDDGASAHRRAIDALAESGIAPGCARDRFCPREAVLRGDVALWLAQAFDLQPGDTDHFRDDDGKPYEWAINALADAGLTEGCAADRYCDLQPTSRGQMASFLSRTIATVRSSGIAP
ncbi:MAG TPA: peptidoglycan recognition protein [Euzebyales bacterium]|nr:peptidoglycan recognition protein [Euzebyales bacterium]